MDAIFFLASRAEACRVTDSDRLPSDPVADPLQIENPRILRALAEALGAESAPKPLRDATCRSFPVWQLGKESSGRIEAMDNDTLDDVADRWREKSGDEVDADAFELTTLLRDLREAVQRREPELDLFVLLEERAW